MPKLEEMLKSKPISDPYHRIVIHIMYTGYWVLSQITLMLKTEDITEPQYNVLRILRGQHGKPMSLIEIQDRMIQKMSNVSRLVDKLMSKELVVRQSCDENRRKVNILITPMGMDLLGRLEQPVSDLIHNLTGHLALTETTELGRLLAKIHPEK